ncbi:MAG TPA: MFS transporter [Acidimicrobiales bacterium]|jgi:EmrB/QacA subfamily drug resistance transporter
MDATTLTRSVEGNDRRRWIALIVVCLAMLMNALDGSIVNVALPSIQRDLHFSQANLTWVIDAYLITFGSLLLMAGRLGDLIGRKRVFLGGVALFTASSAVCGFATSQAMLIAGRFVQGAGGALSASVILAIIITEFPKKAERARAMSAYIFVAVGGGAVGLVVGGIISQTINWHWIFFINLPIGVVTFVLGRALIEENVGLGIRNGVDIAGSILVTTALMVGIYAIVTATQYGWLSVHTLGFVGATAVMLAAFVILEGRLKNPIVPLRILRLRSLMGTSVIRGFLATGMFSTFFLGALYLEHVLHYDPLKTGLAFLPVTLVVATLSTGITARLVERFGSMQVLVPGMVSMTVGLLLLAHAGEHAHYLTDVFPSFFLVGLGAGTAFVPLLTIAMAEVPKDDAGLGSGIVNVSQQMAAAVGLAVLSTLATNRTNALVTTGHRVQAALTSGYQLAFVIGAGCVVVGVIVAPLLLRGSKVLMEENELSSDERREFEAHAV